MCICHYFSLYPLPDCQDFGAQVQNWRSSSFCRESAHFYYLLFYYLLFDSNLTFVYLLWNKTTNVLFLSYFFILQLLHAVPAVIMKPARCLALLLHVLVSMKPAPAARLVLRAVPVMMASISMEPAVCPLMIAAAITMDKHIKWENDKAVVFRIYYKTWTFNKAFLILIQSLLQDHQYPNSAALRNFILHS